MMKKIILMFIMLIFLFIPIIVTIASDDSSLGLSEFLRKMNISFNEYLDVMNAVEETGEHPHYIEDNAIRYKRYQFYNPGLSLCEVIAYVNVNEDYGVYSKVSVVSDPYDISMLVNKHFMLPADWAPDDLVRIENTRYYLREEAANAFTLMRDDMRESGLNLNIVSAFRTYESQEKKHTDNVRWYGLEKADSNLARGGHSEHQSGLSVDVLHRAHSGGLRLANFQDTDEFAWLLSNAYKYGFILRYPEQYQDIHKYIYEPWHWRYVGTDIATAMHNEEIDLYEMFFGKYLTSDVFEKAGNYILASID